MIILDEATSTPIMTRRQLFYLMKGDLQGEVYKKIESFVSEQLQSPFIIPDRFKSQIRSVASKIRNKYLLTNYTEESFLRDEADWLDVCGNY